MIKMPLDEIIFKIQEKTGMSEGDIKQKIDDKMTQLSGLISKEGAAHIIANENGINLFETASGRMKIKDILAGMRDVETVGKVQRIFEVREFQTEKRSGKVGSLMIGDETGVTRVTLWNDQADEISKVKEGDIVKIVSGYVRDNQGRKEIHLNDRSKFIVNPPNEKIDSVKQFTTTRKKITELQEGDSYIEILGTIVQTFEPRFFEVCPECGKRAKPYQDTFVCEEHQKVAPAYSYVLNIILDDGSEPNGSIRVVCFREQVRRLLKMEEEQILKFKESPAEFENVKNDLLGEIVKISGRTTKNTLFDRLEFTAQMVFTDPNPEEEIKRLNSEP